MTITYIIIGLIIYLIIGAGIVLSIDPPYENSFLIALFLFYPLIIFIVGITGLVKFMFKVINDLINDINKECK